MARWIGVVVACWVSFAFSQSDLQVLLQEGDAAFEQHDNQKAVEYFEQVIAQDSSNCEALWKASRSHVNLGEFAEKDEQEPHYETAEMLARKAAQLCPENPDVTLTMAIAVGRLALMRGGKTKVSLSKEVKEYAEETLELDPQNDIAHHILARWHREVNDLSGLLKMFAKVLYGGLPPASKEKAFEHFETAIQLNPDYINHHLEMGITYESEDEWQKAKDEYETVMSLPVQEPRDEKLKTLAEKRLKEVNDKLD